MLILARRVSRRIMIGDAGVVTVWAIRGREVCFFLEHGNETGYKSGVVGEFVRFSDRVRFQIVSVKHDTVRLGFEAPKSVAIDREEIRARKLADGTIPRHRARGFPGPG